MRNSISKKKNAVIIRGFSLVELMVSVSIFAIVMVISIGTLLVLIDANSKAQSEYSAMTNLTFAIDSMSREIRTGYNHFCDVQENNLPDAGSLPGGSGDCGNGVGNVDNEIVFSRGKDNERIAYRLEGEILQQRIGDSGSWLNITSSDIGVTQFKIAIDGTGGSDSDQPQIDMRIEGYVKDGIGFDNPDAVEFVPDFFLQSRITQRVLDY